MIYLVAVKIRLKKMPLITQITTEKICVNLCNLWQKICDVFSTTPAQSQAPTLLTPPIPVSDQ